jgi:hypothetical protein
MRTLQHRGRLAQGKGGRETAVYGHCAALVAAFIIGARVG